MGRAGSGPKQLTHVQLRVKSAELGSSRLVARHRSGAFGLHVESTVSARIPRCVIFRLIIRTAIAGGLTEVADRSVQVDGSKTKTTACIACHAIPCWQKGSHGGSGDSHTWIALKK